VGSDDGLDDQQTCPVHTDGLRMYNFTPVSSIPSVNEVAVKQDTALGLLLAAYHLISCRYFFFSSVHVMKLLISEVLSSGAKIALPRTPQGHIQKETST